MDNVKKRRGFRKSKEPSPQAAEKRTEREGVEVNRGRRRKQVLKEKKVAASYEGKSRRQGAASKRVQRENWRVVGVRRGASGGKKDR